MNANTNTGTTCSDHDPSEPESYVGWHTWAAAMGKTHHQHRCEECGLWRIWIPKSKAALPSTGEKETE